MVKLMYNTLVAFTALTVLLRGCIAKAATKNVVISLDSKWHDTSLLHESCEFMAVESNHAFWRYLNLVSKSTDDFQKFSAKDSYDFALKMAEKLISPARLDLLKFSLSLRMYSPTIEMYRKLSENELDEPSLSSCEAVLDLNGRKHCVNSDFDIESVWDFMGSVSSQAYSVDHHFPGTLQYAKRVIFYVDVGSSVFRKLHGTLKRQALDRKYDYIVRHYVSKVPKGTVRLSGYGVELQIKSTEYKAQDDSKIKINVSPSEAVLQEEETDLDGFNFRKLKELYPEHIEKLDELKLHMLEAEELTPLKVWQLQDLSFQAGQRIVSAPVNEAIRMLQDISQNFPIMARSLTRTVVKDEFRQEVETNQKESFPEVSLSAGESALFINGLLVDLETVDIFTLLEMIKKEEKLSAGFFRMGYRREYLTILTNLDLSRDSETYAVDFRSAFPEFINNLDTDKMYSRWGNSVRIMLQPYFPGMIRPIARNLFNLVFVVDPAAKETRNLLKIAYSFWAHEIPVRIGLVWAVNPDKKVSGQDDAGIALLNLFNFAKTDRKSADALNLLTTFFDDIGDQNLTSKSVADFFTSKFPGEDLDVVFGADSDYDTGRTAGAEFLEKSGLGKAPKVLLNGVPLEESGLSADRFEETVINEIMRLTPKIQKDVMDGKLTDEHNVMDYLLSKPEVMPRLNSRILSSKGAKFLELTDTMEYHHKAKKLYDFARLDDRQMNAYMLKTLKYLKKNDDLGIRPVTVWLVCDVDTKEGRELLNNAIKHLKHSNKMRVAVIHNSRNPDVGASDTVFVMIVDLAMRVLPLNMRKQFFAKLLKEDFASGLMRGTAKLEDIEVHGMDISHFKKELKAASGEFLKIHGRYAHKILDLLPGQRAVIVNGQLIGPFNSSEQLLVEDFDLLERHALSSNAKVIAEQIAEWQIEHDEERSSDVVLRTSALVMADPVRKQRHWVVLRGDKNSTISIPAADETTAAFDVIAIVDPLSREAQKLGSLLGVLLNVINADLKIAMNPKPKLSELPLKSFYRSVLESQLQFAADGSLRHGPSARFSALPMKQLLTLNVHPPESWLVEAVHSVYDLDNIKMEQAEHDIVAEYELTNILLEGHCFDEVTGNPPRGLQFTLGTNRNPLMYDTIVMANLGYFQLKANPGVWRLKLREGRSSEIYDITTHDHTDSPPYLPEVAVVINSFNGKIIRIRVAKKPDKIEEHLLIEAKDLEEQSIWKSISNSLTGSATFEGDNDTTINVFSLASGHLYERFLRIMMRSVLKHAKHPVKFWFLKNYLSPYFKEFLPFMANHYGFQYELVQYKWPRWLHQQSEKQRLIWGYKILFLDVLFPLDVKKIIFVDADQVVRTDLKELMDFDLDGAPYGYTPFCDSRTDMEGFRFWKRGYWANHLAGRKYHISALYVVDLKKFRQIAAGDRLRGQYQGLSADPNSLSNLDQDLPNNMIHQVRIKSLPQDWLWCETWCSDSSKANAKTIDLCNNPQTKEPKLESAMRIIAEWKDYDDEIRRLQEIFYAQERDAQAAVQIGVPASESSDEATKSTAKKEKPQRSDVHGEL